MTFKETLPSNKLLQITKAKQMERLIKLAVVVFKRKVDLAYSNSMEYLNFSKGKRTKRSNFIHKYKKKMKRKSPMWNFLYFLKSLDQFWTQIMIILK